MTCYTVQFPGSSIRNRERKTNLDYLLEYLFHSRRVPRFVASSSDFLSGSPASSEPAWFV